MGENVFSNYHRSSVLHTANGREKGLPVGKSGGGGLELGYCALQNQKGPPAMQVWSKQ